VFEISWSEIFIVAVVAIIFVGPKELPAMLRTFGRLLGQLRRTAGEFQRTFNDALREAERQANVDKMRKDLDAMKAGADPTRDLRKNFDDLGRAFTGRPTDPVPPAPPAAGVDAAAAVAPSPAAAAAAGAPPVQVVAPQAPVAASAPPVQMVAPPAPAPASPPPAEPALPADNVTKLERVAGDRR
jgi:sec-independent protein translocase protein TatB